MKTDAINRYRRLTGTIMLEQASPGKTEWPVRNEHCFQGIVLDVNSGGIWYINIARPAYKHLGDAQALWAVKLCEDIIAGHADVADLNRKSLTWRGKLPASAKRKPYP